VSAGEFPAPGRRFSSDCYRTGTRNRFRIGVFPGDGDAPRQPGKPDEECEKNGHANEQRQERRIVPETDFKTE
jgi:hypothetical protein